MARTRIRVKVAYRKMIEFTENFINTFDWLLMASFATADSFIPGSFSAVQSVPDRSNSYKSANREMLSR